MTPLNIVFAGTPEFGLPCLDALIQSPHVLQAIYTQPDRPAGRGRQLQASAVKQWALEHSIPVFQPLHFKTEQAIEELKALKPDVMIVIAYGLILPKAVLDIPRLGCINVHASLLPRWRGASPIQQAILHGDAESGVTIMQMDVGLDTGDMLSKASCPILENDTAGTLHNKLAQLAFQPLLKTLAALNQNRAEPEAQSEALVTYAGKISKEQGRINWQQSAKEIDQLIRAFNPWPIAYTLIDEVVLRIHQAQVIDTCADAAAGTILSLDKTGMLVAAGKGSLLIEKIQFPNAKIVSVNDWLNSGKTQLFKGLVFA